MIWLTLVFITAIAFIATINYRQEILRLSLCYGALLVIIDFVVQSLGAYFKLWKTTGSILFVGAVPIEVLVIAFMAGSIVARLTTDIQPCILGIAVAGVGAYIEAMLVKINVLHYYSAWNSALAFATYLVIFTLYTWFFRLRLEAFCRAGRAEVCRLLRKEVRS